MRTLAVVSCLVAYAAASAMVGTLDQMKRPVHLHSDGQSTSTVEYPGVDYVKVRVTELSAGAVVEVTDLTGEQGQEIKSAGQWALTTFSDAVRVTVRGGSAVVGEAYHGFSDEGEKRLANLLQFETVCGSDNRQEAKCWEDQYPAEYQRAQAVARLTMPCEPGSSGSCTCTAWRVAGRSDALITNNHCISDRRQVPAAEVFFRFENSRCRGNDARRQQISVSVNEILVTDEGLDMTLFTINNPSRVSEFGALELDARAPRRGEEIYIPQHPGGRDKEIAINTDGGQRCTVDASSTRGGRDMGYRCDTEGGSSGSPVLSASSHRVIGLHHLGGCNNGGVRVDQFYSRVSRFLNGGSSPPTSRNPPPPPTRRNPPPPPTRRNPPPPPTRRNPPPPPTRRNPSPPSSPPSNPSSPSRMCVGTSRPVFGCGSCWGTIWDAASNGCYSVTTWSPPATPPSPPSRSPPRSSPRSSSPRSSSPRSSSPRSTSPSRWGRWGGWSWRR